MKKDIVIKAELTPKKNRAPFSFLSIDKAFRLYIIVFIMALLSSCATNKDAIAAGLPAPDTGFYTGDVAGYTVYIWECHQDKRIVIFNTSAEFTSTDYERQESACGGVTPIEEQLKDEPKKELDPSLFWR